MEILIERYENNSSANKLTTTTIEPRSLIQGANESLFFYLEDVPFVNVEWIFQRPGQIKLVITLSYKPTKDLVIEIVT